ncbi:MAG: hypothetical protein JO213_01195 [Alphaproteobacteria bacterium]|nr:hypothetical protein [Alphaproteobacteria bacterium]MBV9152462.1 hypothetical protein [Alphaproteobacteria bacterium]MBV9583485.1 hypothetical protein [Alphaproteobacteria bacterium]MBV9964808.1 hypothetical protein [Alphaproteobacteria bacterium]
MREQTAIEFCRDAAARFQLLADIEPWPSLRKQYSDSAAQYRAQAVALLKNQQRLQVGQRAA